MKVNIYWFRRDLRIEDNTAFRAALSNGHPVLPLFIFDTSITGELRNDDPRITFIYDSLLRIDEEMKINGGGLLVVKGEASAVWKDLMAKYNIANVFANRDYEPYAVKRDAEISEFLSSAGVTFKSFKDQVVFEPGEILKDNREPYTVFTPYSKKWLTRYFADHCDHEVPEVKISNLATPGIRFPSLSELGFRKSALSVRNYDLSVIKEYEKYRELPFADRTSYLSPHLRFGTVSIRKIARKAWALNRTFLNELIWREFFMQILGLFPETVTSNFRRKYDGIEWRNNENEFRRWCNGETGYPIVDAGMRQLNETGYMHNRVRMITASFLCKHLLIDWRWGEAYFAERLLDYELSSNNGNWQWAAGTGCDAAPYFRVFSPDAQEKKFDPQREYIRKWVRDIDRASYPKPVVDHDYARKRAIDTYKSGLLK